MSTRPAASQNRPVAPPLVAVALASLVSAAAIASVPSGQVQGSKHDFSGDNAGSEKTGVCTFCHTPHRGYATKPAWNHTLPNNTYFWNKVSTDDGTPYPVIIPSWSGATKFCLSCHDGSTAIGSVAWFNGRSWTGGAAIDPNDHNGDNVQVGTVNGNLTGNHPLAHPYPFAGAPSTYNGVTTAAGALAAGWKPDPTILGIRLFHDVGGDVSAGPVVGSSGIECSSCHDFHGGPDVEDKFFLRGSADVDDPNYICNKCHNGMGDFEKMSMLWHQ